MNPSQNLGDVENQLLARVQPDGGVGHQRGGPSRADATAWAMIVLSSTDADRECVQRASMRLATDQRGDGSMSISPGHPEAVWPTSLAILAWSRCPGADEARQRAIAFLLNSTGNHWRKQRNDIAQHDPALKGWPWIAATHSWVEPTALSMTALSCADHHGHPRLKEATHMLIDRQLPHGGWNYGNTSVFGQELRPAPESTGAALHALAGRVAPQDVQASLDYLSKETPRLKTPIALGWSLLGLNAWGAAPPNAAHLLDACLGRQNRYGPYDTASLCLLVLPLLSPDGLLGKATGTV